MEPLLAVAPLAPAPAAAAACRQRLTTSGRSLCAGKDATEEFEEIGHSRAAKEMLDKYYIGDFAVSPSGLCMLRGLLANGYSLLCCSLPRFCFVHSAAAPSSQSNAASPKHCHMLPYLGGCRATVCLTAMTQTAAGSMSCAGCCIPRFMQGGAPPKKAPKRAAPAAAAAPGSSGLSSLIKALLPLLIVLAAVYYMQLQQGKA